MQILSQYLVTIDSKGNELMKLLRQAIDVEKYRTKFSQNELIFLHENIDKGDYVTHLETYSHSNRVRKPYLDKYKLQLN